MLKYICLFLILWGGWRTPLAHAVQTKTTLTLWHTFDTAQAKIFTKFIDEFERKKNVKIQLETGVEVEAALLAKMENNQLPDVVLGPSNLVSLTDKLKFSKIEPKLQTKEVPQKLYHTALYQGTLRGIPLLAGNHLLLYYNKKYITNPPKSWTDLEKQANELRKNKIEVLAMDYHEPYVFAAFLNTFDAFPIKNEKLDIDTDRVRDALKFYKHLSKENLVPLTCDFDCPLKRFFAGEFAFAINGDWAYAETKEKLGSAFGVTYLPMIGSRTMKSFMATQILLFPSDSLNGKNAKILRDLALFLQSEDIQSRWYLEGLRLPVVQSVMKKLFNKMPEDEKVSIRQFDRSVSMPNMSLMPSLWQALKKGLRLYLQDLQNESEVTKYMQRLASSGAK